MKLKEGEEILKDYYFIKNKQKFTRGILTNKRLIFITKTSMDNESEENYPLSKITSVKTEKETNDFRSKVLGFSVILLVILLIVTGILIFNEDKPKWNGILYIIPIYLIDFWLIRFGIKPDKVITKLVITQMGGTKKYLAKNNKDLEDFIEKINEQLI